MTEVSRRAVLKAGALGGASVGLGGCEQVVSWFSERMGQGVPDRLDVPTGAAIDPTFHLLSRAGWGPWPGDLERVREQGHDAWIDEQLDPASIDDGLCDLRARRFETIHHDPGTCYEYKKQVLREEIARHTMLRAIYSKRQLYEVLVEFWTDHFNIDLDKGDCVYLKPADDREVVRAHALGRFRDLVRASATSPAMLVYLDGKDNKKRRPDDVPNENYARELLELHTLGVDGGYGQGDVSEVARCLTGWRIRSGWRNGTVWFDASEHDDGAKVVLGESIPAGGGERDLDRVVDVVCRHPSTARHLARKLCRRLVAEDPPASIVDEAARVFAGTDGDVRAVVRAILRSSEFAASAGAKVKRPFRFLVSALRAVAADTHAHQGLLEYLGRLGQPPFGHPTPDGYAEEGEAWLGTLLWRWNFGFSLAGDKVGSVDVPWGRVLEATGGRPFAHLVGRDPTAAEEAALAKAPDDRTRAALVLSSPAFQRY